MVRILHRVELNESNNNQRDDSHSSTVSNDILIKKLRGSRNMDDLDDPRRSGLGLKPRPKLTPKEKLKELDRQVRIQRRDNFKGAIQQGKSAISRKFKKGWKGSTLPAEQAVQDTAKWPDPGGSTHIISRGQKKVKGAKALKGEVHGEEMDMARPVGEGGEVTRNRVATTLNKPQEGGHQVVPKTSPFQSHDDNIRSLVKLGNEYAGTPSRKDRMPEKRKGPRRPSVKIER
jgi:hypothetical protein